MSHLAFIWASICDCWLIKWSVEHARPALKSAVLRRLATPVGGLLRTLIVEALQSDQLLLHRDSVQIPTQLKAAKN